MKKTVSISFAVSAVLILVGCGGGSSKDTAPKTGTAYYQDSAVIGVDYKCGNQSGVTGKDGKFIFEKGKDCKFSLAGIELKKVPKDKLADGKKIVEDNASVAAVLQSLDADGNASNGIEIKPEVKKAFEEQIKKQQVKIKTLTQLTEQLEAQIADLKQQLADKNVTIQYVAPEKAIEHAHKTKKNVIQELIGGKSLYLVVFDYNDNEVEKYIYKFNKNLTKIDFEELNDWEGHIERKGSLDMRYLPETDEIISDGKVIKILNYNNTKLDLEDEHSHHKVVLFFKKADAKAYAEKLEKEHKPKNDGKASSWKALAGKTLYFIDEGEVKAATLSSDLKTIKFSNKTSHKTYHISSISGNKLVDEEGAHYLDEITDKYIKGHDKHGEFIMYFSEADAKAHAGSSNGGDSGNHSLKFTKDMVVGKTVYMSYIDHTGDKVYQKATFNSNGTISYKESTGYNGTFKYKIDSKGYLKIETDEDYTQFKLKSVTSNSWVTEKSVDEGKDGTVDGSKEKILYTQKPSDFPSDF